MDNMKNYEGFSYITCVVSFILLFPFSVLAHKQEEFLQCLHYQLINTNHYELIYTPNEPSYFTVLNSTLQNPRFDSPFYRKPDVIITPADASHVQATIYCSRKHGFEIRTRSGGHDFEGLSYVSYDAFQPFIVIDLFKYRYVSVNVHDRTAWIQAGATIGEIAYAIANKSSNLGFPDGICHTVGIGGHVSGGGWGTLLRKHGLAADHVIDAEIVDAEGRVLDRNSMGEDLFWAIRGGGGASFGVILSWKIRLVHVPSCVTILNVVKIFGAKDAAKLVHRWQQVAYRFDEDLFLALKTQTVNVSSTPGGSNKVMLRVIADGFFLGGAEKLIRLVRREFPELGLERDDCSEMRWIDSVLYFAGFPTGQSPEALADRMAQLPQSRSPDKSKSDFVTEPIPKKALEILLRRLFDVEVGKAFYQFAPLGGKMSEISENAIPYPHRRGNIYLIHYLVFWEQEENVGESQWEVSWIRSIYNYMAPYVSKNPRSSYINYRDLDIGNGSRSYVEARVWGVKYFKSNFKRLVEVKTEVDPTNFFRNEQSIPPFPTN